MLTSAVMRRRLSRPHPTSGRRPPGPSFPTRPLTLEDARRWSTASARSEAEPRTRTAARPLTSAAMRCRPSRPPPPPGRRPPVFPLHSIFVASAMRRARQTGPGPSRGSTSPAGAGRAQAPARRETRTADTLRVVDASLAPPLARWGRRRRLKLQRRRTLVTKLQEDYGKLWRSSAAGGLRQAGGGLRQAWTTASWLLVEGSRRPPPACRIPYPSTVLTHPATVTRRTSWLPISVTRMLSRRCRR